MGILRIERLLDEIDPQRRKELGFIYQDDIVLGKVYLLLFDKLPEELRNIAPIQCSLLRQHLLVGLHGSPHSLALFSRSRQIRVRAGRQ